MNYKRIEELLKKPDLYEPGTKVMWTDPHIQPLLLEAHLDVSIDAASRKPSNIAKTISWMESILPKGSLDLLDLGCGPGLYTVEFAKKGHRVVGMDFSKHSNVYARKEAIVQNLTIEYIDGDYLNTPFHGMYDAIYIIFCDFGVLSNTDQKRLLKKVHQALKPGGIFFVDGYNHKYILEEKKDYEVELEGFWRPHPYMVLFSRFVYPKNHAFLEQHVVIDDSVEVYRFYNHRFTSAQMTSVLTEAGFQEVIVGENIIDDGTVTFYATRK